MPRASRSEPKRLVAWIAWLLLCSPLASGAAQALEIVAETDPAALAAALTGPDSGLGVTGVALSGHAVPGLGDDDDEPPTRFSTGLFENASGVYGIGPGIVLSTGNVLDYGDGPDTSGSFSTQFGVPASSAQRALASQVTGASFSAFDATQLDLFFDLSAGSHVLTLDLVFGSEEFPEFVGTKFTDGFGVFLNGQNVALVDGQTIQVDHPEMQLVDGTELDALLAPGGDPLVRLALELEGGADQVLSFLIFDTSDSILDSTVYLSKLVLMPEPGTALLVGAGLALLGTRRSGRGRAARTWRRRRSDRCVTRRRSRAARG